jgi:AcrR family transcriptional regulator
MNQRVSREDWVEAALMAIAEGGLKAITVEALARQLSVTKGSFYNYFANVDELTTGALTRWEELATDVVIRTLDALPGAEDRLKRLFELVCDRVDHLKIESALMAAAVAGDDRVRPAYLRVNRRRLVYTKRLYTELGLSDEHADRWALTAYGSYLGLLQLVALGASAFRSQSDLRAHAQHLGRTLVPPRAHSR